MDILCGLDLTFSFIRYFFKMFLAAIEKVNLVAQPASILSLEANIQLSSLCVHEKFSSTQKIAKFWPIRDEALR